MGHDAVSHIHEADIAMSEHTAMVSHSSNNGLSDLQNVFSLLQHGSAGRNLVYLGAAEKKADFQKKPIFNTPFLFVGDYRIAWYTNYKKQRFREYITIPSSYIFKYFFLRGPPSC